MRVPGPANVLLYIVFLSIQGCTGGAVLKVHMVSFSNSGKDIKNRGCDWFSPGCDHYFTFYFDEYGMTTGKFKNTYSIRFGNNMNGVSNPVVIRFQKWKGSVRMSVKVMDDDDRYSSDDLVDYIYYTYKGTPGPTSASPNIQHHNLRGSRSNRGVTPTTLSVTFELYCEPNFYGTACDVECVPRDDGRGHYECDADTGHIVCMEGWEGDACTVKTDHCHQHDHDCQNGATCRVGDNTYSCLCPEGFSGHFCELTLTKAQGMPVTRTPPVGIYLIDLSQDVNILPIAVGVAVVVLLLLIILPVAILVGFRRRRERRQDRARLERAKDQRDNQVNRNLLINWKGAVIINYPSPPLGDPNGTGLDTEGQPMLVPPSFNSNQHQEISNLVDLSDLFRNI